MASDYDEDLKVKVSILEERIANVKSAQADLKYDMDKKFEALDVRFSKLSDQMQAGFAELKDVVSESKGFFKGSKWVGGLVLSIAGLLGTLVGFLIKAYF
jgi:hypothetical protein